MKGAFVQLFDDTDPLRSDVTLCAAALLTLGIPRHGKSLLHFTTERIRGAAVRRAVWTFAGASPCGRFSTHDMITGWDSAVWLERNQSHPLAIIRASLTYDVAMKFTPKFTPDYRRRVETPETWRETAVHNLLVLLRDMPAAMRGVRGVIRFGPEHMAFVPLALPQEKQTRLIKYAEHPDKRPEIRAA